jgi:hypothetical protein
VARKVVFGLTLDQRALEFGAATIDVLDGGPR